MPRTADDDDASTTSRGSNAAFIGGLGVVKDWVEICSDLMRADGAAVVASSTLNPDVRRVVHVTGKTAARVADLLHVLGPGVVPGASADGSGGALLVEDPVAARRWPLATTELAALDVAWVRTFPLTWRSDTVGILQLHRTAGTDRAVPDGIEVLVGALARHMAPDVARAVTAQLGRDAGDDDVIDRSTGVLMARHRLSSSAAAAVLRAESYAASTTVAAHARTIIDSLGT